jgi:RNA polymerase sigma-70 factor (ECF subfamily)
MSSLRQGLLGAAPPEALASLAARADLDAELAGAVARARAAWPEIAVADDDFMRFLAEHISLDDGAVIPLQLPEDLYLACACSLGDEQAIRAFQQRYEPNYRAVFERMGLGSAADDLCQLLLRRLFIAEGRRRAAIANFSGKGALGQWVKVLAAREGHRYLERGDPKGHRVVERDPDEIAARLGEIDPEVDRLKEGYRARFKQAFAEAFHELPERERNLFRLQYLDGLNLDRMAAVYNVGRATVARWRTRARQQLLEQTRHKLAGELGASSRDVESILRFIDSQLDISLTRLLRADDEPR